MPKILTREHLGKKHMDKKLENVLASPQAFKCLVENAALPIAITDTKGRFIYVNKALADVLGYLREEIIGRAFTKFLHPEDRLRVMRLFLRILLLKRQPRSLEFRVICKGGQIRHFMSKPTKFTMGGKTLGFQALMTEVTELKNMEARLIETNRRFEMFLKNAMEGITIVDANENILFANRAFAEMLGYGEKELHGVNLLKFVDEEGLRKIKAETEFRRKGLVSRYELTLYRKDGKPRLVQVSASPLWNEDGSYAGALAIVMDVTERRRMEMELKESEERLRKFIEYAPDAIYVNDLDGKFLDGNRQAEILTGYSREELIGKSMFKVRIFPEKWLPKIIEAIETNKRGERFGPEEFELIRKDGSPVFVEISSIPVTRRGKVEVIGIARDITERKKSEEALRESEEKFRNIFESANDCFIFLNTLGTILDVNKKATQVFGGRKEELIGKHFLKLGVVSAKDVPRLLNAFSRIIMGKEGYMVLWIKNKRGQKFCLECSSSIMKLGDGRIFISVVARDITERKQMQKKLEEYSQYLEKLVEERTKALKEAQEQLIKSERLAAIGQVAAMVGHDLRNPLTSIAGATYYLKKKLWRNIDATARKMFRIIERDVEYSNDVLADLLDYSREIKLNFVEATPKALLREVLSTFKIPKRIEVADETTEDPMIVDKEKLKRVFVNIIKNAIAAMPKGGKLTISSRKIDDSIEISFTDTGVGVSKEVLEKIWTPFFTTKAKGLGLGLPICKRIVDAHDGKITVESTPNKGTKFTVTIPVKPKDEKEKEEKIWIKAQESSLLTTTKA
jgi:PAS domain S-box-containing protein